MSSSLGRACLTVFFPSASPSLKVLYIQAFVLVFLLGKFMGKVFFGQLRAAEMEVSGAPVPGLRAGSYPLVAAAGG